MPALETSRPLRFVTVILRWLVVAGLVFVLAKFAGTFITEHSSTPIYKATAQIRVRPHGFVDSSNLTDRGTTSAPGASVFESEFVFLREPEVLLPVIHQLKLNETWAKQLPSQGGTVSDVDALAYLHKLLTLDWVPGTNVITITVKDEDAKEAAGIADSVSTEYKKFRDSEDLQLHRREIVGLQDHIEFQQKAAFDAAQVVEKMLKERGLDRPDHIPPDIAQGLADFDKVQSGLLAALNDFFTARALARKMVDMPDAQFVDALKIMGRNPDVATDANGVPDKDQVARLRQSLQTDAVRAGANVDQKRLDVNKLMGALTAKMGPGSGVFLELRANAAAQQNTLDQLRVHLKQTRAEIPQEQSPVHILANAEVPTKADHPAADRTTNIVAVILALVVASFVEMIFLFRRASERTGN